MRSQNIQPHDLLEKLVETIDGVKSINLFKINIDAFILLLFVAIIPIAWSYGVYFQNKASAQVGICKSFATKESSISSASQTFSSCLLMMHQTLEKDLLQSK